MAKRELNLFSDFSKEQTSLFKKLNTPQKIQDFLNTLKINFRNAYWSPKKVIEKGKAQCLEGAMLAAAILRFHGSKPLVVDLKTTDYDEDHVLQYLNKTAIGAQSPRPITPF